MMTRSEPKRENGNPISGVAISVAGLSSITDSFGHFEFVIPGDRMQRELDLEAIAPGYAPVNFNSIIVVLTSGDLRLDAAILKQDEKMRQSAAQAKKAIEGFVQILLLKAQLHAVQFRF